MVPGDADAARDGVARAALSVLRLGRVSASSTSSCYLASLDDDALGLGTHRAGDQTRAAYRTAIVTATR